MLGDISKDVEELETQFSELADSTFDLLSGTEIRTIKSRLASMPVKKKKIHEEFLTKLWDESTHVVTLEDVWGKLGPYWNFSTTLFLNFSLISLEMKILQRK